MIIRATILVFALMFYMMVVAGGHATLVAPSAASESAPIPKASAPREMKPTEGQTAASAERAAPERSKPGPLPDLIRISADRVTAGTAHSPQGGTGFFRLDEAALHGLTYAAAEKAISEQFTGPTAAGRSQMTVRQALILGCGLMMREAQTVGVQSRGKFEKLDLHRPLVDASLSTRAPRESTRTH